MTDVRTPTNLSAAPDDDGAEVMLAAVIVGSLCSLAAAGVAVLAGAGWARTVVVAVVTQFVAVPAAGAFAGRHRPR